MSLSRPEGTSGWQLPSPGPGVPGPLFLLMPCTPAHRGAQAGALCRACLLDLTRGTFSILRETDEPRGPLPRRPLKTAVRGRGCPR